MARHQIVRDGARLSGVDTGSGRPVVFQHGLGGDERQVADVFPDGGPWRRLTLECRGQGRSEPGPLERLSLATFADDVIAFADERGVQHFAAGGISMGAALALRLAVIAPERVRALVLARPAWMAERSPDNLRPYAEVGALFAGPDRSAARATFLASATARRLADEAPDNLASLSGFFAADRPPWTGTLLRAIASDGPGVTAAEIGGVRVPTLVIGHGRDVAHPLAHARDLAAMIGGARLVEITPKATDVDAYRREFRTAVSAFLATLPLLA